MKTSEILEERLNRITEQHKTDLENYKAGKMEYRDYEYITIKYYDESKDLTQQIATEQNREIEVGDGCTIHYWSDKEAYTVIKRTPKTITIQRDKATLDPSFKPEWIAGGFAGTCINQNEQTYTYERNPEGAIITAHWSEKYGCFKANGCYISNGRHEFYDYNF